MAKFEKIGRYNVSVEAHRSGFIARAVSDDTGEDTRPIRHAVASDSECTAFDLMRMHIVSGRADMSAHELA